MESSSSIFHLNNLMCCIWHGELFGAIMGGAEVDVCPYIPLDNWLATFSFLLGRHARVSLTENIPASVGLFVNNKSAYFFATELTL